MISKIKKDIFYFINSKDDYPLVYAIAAGVYPVLFYYSNNYTLANSWMHLLFFLVIFLGIPIFIFFLVSKFSKYSLLKKYKNRLVVFLSVFIFFFLLKVSLFALEQRKISLAILIISFIASSFLLSHHKKIVVIQLVLIFIGCFSVVNTVIKQHSISNEWMKQPDDISNVIFKTKPNVYFIQPDGYVNFSELNKGYYNLQSNKFETFLSDNDFTYYKDFRSNYTNTLSSNSSSLMMKHHFYNNVIDFNEVVNQRNIIVSKNTVLDIFKNNGYKNYFITEVPYLLLNRPKMGFDYCNIDYENVPFLGNVFGEIYNIIEPLEYKMEKQVEVSKFFFIEILSPGHVSASKMYSQGVDKEKQAWVKRLDRSHEVLTKTIATIKRNDPNALIIMMADHGGFVGMKYSLESTEKTEDRDKIYSMFSASLAIHWPNGKAPSYDNHIKSSVNIFRILFTYLSENEEYLEYLQKDISYSVIKKGAPSGVYELIDDNGKVVFNRHLN